MSYAAVAERYARAIFELGTETNRLEQLSEQIARFAETYDSSSLLRTVLGNPILGESKRTGVINELARHLQIAGPALNAVLLLARRRRLAVLPEISKRLISLSDEKLGVLRVHVTSAKPLGESYAGQLVSLLEKATSKKVRLGQAIDESLIGGLITRIGDHTVDGSIRGRLAELGQRLMATPS